MKTVFNILRQASGLSLREAAEFCEVRFDTARNWDHGRRTPPNEVINRLHDLSSRVQFVATETLSNIRELPEPKEIIIGYAADDYEAQQPPLNWTFASTQYAMLGILLSLMRPEELSRVVLVPRGTTIESAAAEDAHLQLKK